MKHSTHPYSTNPQDAMQVLRDLDTGIMNHMGWMKNLHRILVCSSAPEASDLSDDAHCLCKFGRWYYQGSNYPELRENPVFKKIGNLHKIMHDDARTLLLKKGRGEPISHEDYNAFMDHAINFKWEVRCLQFEIVKQVCVIDHLTGAMNRQSMLSKLAEEMERMARSGQSCCICMMDIDHFKRVNDEHGHTVGDQVLQSTVRFITDRLRKYDSIFRYGGEEFLLCLPATQLEEAESILRRVRDELAQYAAPIQDGKTLSVTASFGIAAMNPAISIQDAIDMADHALLCAKAKGRNQVCTWGIEE